MVKRTKANITKIEKKGYMWVTHAYLKPRKVSAKDLFWEFDRDLYFTKLDADIAYKDIMIEQARKYLMTVEADMKVYAKRHAKALRRYKALGGK